MSSFVDAEYEKNEEFLKNLQPGDLFSWTHFAIDDERKAIYFVLKLKTDGMRRNNENAIFVYNVLNSRKGFFCLNQGDISSCFHQVQPPNG